jgi:hypothetical protein
LVPARRLWSDGRYRGEGEVGFAAAPGAFGQAISIFGLDKLRASLPMVIEAGRGPIS